MASIDDSVQVNVPVSSAYNQWTQFEDFSRFMKGVHEVKQLDDTHLHWRAEVMGKDVEWDSEITRQIPDRAIEWRTTAGLPNAGRVEFAPLADGHTEVKVHIDYEPRGALENLGSATGVASARVHTALERFKSFLEERGRETGAWRGEV